MIEWGGGRSAAEEAGSLSFGGGLGLRVEEHALANGLKLVLVPDPCATVFTIMLWVPAGLRTEPEGLWGISHYLEHCYSLGSRLLGPRELDRVVAGLGGTKNAFTSYDTTAYYENLPSEALGRIVELEADRFAHLTLPAERIANELEVVKEERRLRIDNAPTGRLSEALTELAYEAHPYRYPVIGTAASLERLDRAAVLAYYQAHYVPRNATFVLSGGFDPAEACALFERWFGGLDDRPAPAVAAACEPAQTRERRRVIDRQTPKVPFVSLLHKAPPFDHPDTAALEVLSEVLLGNRYARMPRRLVRELKLVTSLSGGLWGLKDPSPFTITARAQHGVQAEQVEAAILDVLDEVQERGVTDEEVAAVRRRLRLGLLAGLESAHGRARTLGRFHVTAAGGWRALPAWLDRLAAVTPDDVQRVARQHLVKETRSVVWQIPTHALGRTVEVRGMTGPARGERPTAQPAAEPEPAATTALPERPATVVEPERTPPFAHPERSVAESKDLVPFGSEAFRVTLPNGLVVLLEPTGRLPVVAVTLCIRAGSAYEPLALGGLSTITASLLTAGTAHYGEEAYGQAFAALGTTLTVPRGADVVQLATLCQSEDLGALLDLVAEAALRPRFEGERLERVRREQVSRKKAWRAEPAELCGQAFHHFVHGPGHPYAHGSAGTLPGLEAIGEADVRAFYASMYAPGRAALSIAGAIDPGRALAAVERAFGAWSAAAAAPEPEAPPEVRPPQSHAVYLVPKDDQSQANIRIGHALFRRGHPDWDPVVLLNEVLGGGGLAARIPARVRTREGLAYSARSYLMGRRWGGAFVMGAETKTSTCLRAIELMEEELRRVRREPIPGPELERARARLCGTLPFRVETAARKAAALANAEVFGLGPDYLHAQVERFRGLDAEALLAAARAHLDPEALVRVVVGREAELRPALERLGPVRVVREDELEQPA